MGWFISHDPTGNANHIFAIVKDELDEEMNAYLNETVDEDQVDVFSIANLTTVGTTSTYSSPECILGTSYHEKCMHDLRSLTLNPP